MVLDLLVDEQDDDDDDCLHDALRERGDAADDECYGRADERDEVEDRHDHRQRERVRDSGGHQRDRRDRSRDEADQQVSRDVAADCAVDPVEDPLPAWPRARRHDIQDAVDPTPAVEEHEEGQERNGDERQCGVGSGSCSRRSGALQPEQTGDAAAFVDVDELLAEMEALLEKCERAPLGVEVSEIVRERLDEVRGRGDERRDHEESEQPERGEGDDEDDRGRTATADSATLERTDRRIERHREERSDEHPGDRLQRQVHEHQREDRAGGDRHPDEDRLRRERDPDRRLGRATFRRRLDRGTRSDPLARPCNCECGDSDRRDDREDHPEVRSRLEDPDLEVHAHDAGDQRAREEGARTRASVPS